MDFRFCCGTGPAFIASASADGPSAGSEGGLLSRSGSRSKACSDRWSGPGPIDTVASTAGTAAVSMARRNGVAAALAAPREMAAPFVPVVRDTGALETDKQV